LIDSNTARCITELKKVGCTVTLTGAPLNGQGEPTGVRVLRPDSEVPDGVEYEFSIEQFKLIGLRTVLKLQEEGEID
jgi:hypothetical protein